MGLRCLLGHDFTEPTIEREREERGDEVIITIRRVKECKRCGETRIVSENKEVTSMDRPLGGGERDGEAGAVDAGSKSRGDRPPRESEGEGAAAASDDAAAAGTGGVADRGSPGWASDRSDADAADADPSPDSEFDHPEADLDGVDTDVEDDAEIIPSAPDGDPDVRGRGEWPDADVNRSTIAERTDRTGVDRGGPAPADDNAVDTDDTDDAAAGGTGPTDPADEDAEFIDAADDGDEGGAAGEDAGEDDRVPWPDHDGNDEGFDATFGGEDGDATVSAGGTAAGRRTDASDGDDGPDGDDAEFIEAESEPLDATADVGATSDSRWATNGSDGERAGRTAGDARGSGVSGVELRTTSGDPDAEYVCPECGTREPVGASSMRAGDICPDCKRGYIEERALE